MAAATVCAKRDQVKRLKELETEDERLRKAVSDLTLECPSSDDLRLIRWLAKRGSGSSGVRV
jgi:hypothetical protein